MSNQEITTKKYIVPINVAALRVGANEEITASKLKGPELSFETVGKYANIGQESMQPLIGQTNDQAGSVLLSNTPSGASNNTAPGIRLHWALPDALVKGELTDGQSEITFPTLPDTWLITAYYFDNTNKTNYIAQWVVESSTVAATKPTQQPTVAILGDLVSNNVQTTTPESLYVSQSAKSEEYNTQYLGKVTPLVSAKLVSGKWSKEANSGSNAWTAPAAADVVDLNAMSHYGPTFTAYYQHGAASFGFYDDLSTVGLEVTSCNITVSYQVIGWHRNAADDLLSEAVKHASTAYQQQVTAYTNAGHTFDTKQMAYLYEYIQEQYGWAMTDIDDDNLDFPSTCQTYYQGMVMDVVYNATTDYLTATAPDDIEVAIGNNASEAIATTIANNTVDPVYNAKEVTDASSPNAQLENKTNVEFLLDAFQQDFLRQLVGTNPTFRLEQVEGLLHQSRFGKMNGGQIWLIRSVPKKDQKQLVTDTFPEQLPTAMLDALNQLNVLQETYDANERSLDTLRSQVFDDWVSAYYDGGNNATDVSSQYPLFINEVMALFVKKANNGQLTIDTASGTQKFTPFGTVANKNAAGALLSSDASGLGLLDMVIVLQTQLPAMVQQLVGGTGQVDTWQQLATLFSSSLSTVFSNITAGISALEANAMVGSLLKGGSISTSDVEALNDKIFVAGNAATSATYSDLAQVVDLQAFLVNMQQYLLNNQLGTSIDTYYTSAAQVLTQAQSTFTLLQTSVATKVQSLIASLQKQTKDAFVTQLVTSLDLKDSAPKLLATMVSYVANNLATFMVKNPTYNVASLTTNVFEPIAQVILKAAQALLNHLPLGQQVLIQTQFLQKMITASHLEVALQMKKAPAFAMPTEPVIALTEKTDHTKYLKRVNRNGRSQYLPCRQDFNLVASLSIGGVPLSLPTFGNDLSDDNTFSMPESLVGNLSHDNIFQKMLTEGFLMTPYNAYVKNADYPGYLATFYQNYQSVQKDLTQPPVVREKLLAYQTKVNETVKEFWTLDNTKLGNTNKIEVNEYAALPYYTALNVADADNPFLPLYLAWKVQYTGLDWGNKDSNNYLINQVKFDSGAANNLVPVSSAGLGKDTIEFIGQMVLSDSANKPLLHQLELYFSNTWQIDITKGKPDKLSALQSELYETYRYLTKNVVLAQGLSGFNEALLQRIQGYQLGFNNGSGYNDQTAFAYLTSQLSLFTNTSNAHNWHQQDPFWKRSVPANNENIVSGDSYFPLRGGALTLESLQIVDVFGQYIEVAIDNISRAKVANSLTNGTIGPIYLAPRLVQPARIHWKWLPAVDTENAVPAQEFLDNPAYSPVAGWLMANHVDGSLYTYDNEGNTLGYFGFSTEGAVWHNAPHSAAQTATKTLAECTASATTLFQDFLSNFLGKLNDSLAAALQAAMAGLQQAQLGTALAESPSMAILTGRPLIVAKTSLQLEIYGDFLTNPQHYKTDAVAALPKRGIGEINQVNLPVKLGQENDLYDGLLGYFVERSTPAETFSTFYVCSGGGLAAAGVTHRGITIKPATISDFALNLSTSTSQTLILVMDPRTSVHVTTGVLPQQSLRVPVADYQKAMTRIKVYLSAMPLLLNTVPNEPSGSLNYQFPIPKEAGYDWHWVQPGLPDAVSVTSEPLNDHAKFFGYAQIQDGWLMMQEATTQE